MIQCFKAGGTFRSTSQRIRPLIFLIDFVQNGQLILDERAITHDAVTDNTEDKLTDPMVTYMKSLEISYPVFRGRGHVQSHFSANPTIDFGSIMSKSGQLILDERSITHDAVTDNAEDMFTDPMVTYMNVMGISYPVFQGRGHVQKHFSANPSKKN